MLNLTQAKKKRFFKAIWYLSNDRCKFSRILNIIEKCIIKTIKYIES